MNNWLVFAGDSYYPQGGWHDFIGAFNTLEAAKAAAIASKSDWWHVVNYTTAEIVAS